MTQLGKSNTHANAVRTAKMLVGVIAVCVAIITCVAVLVVPYAQNAHMRDSRLLVAIDEHTFPDTAWRTFVASSFDTNADGYLSEEEAQAVTHIGSYDTTSFEVIDEGISHKGITSLEGIERFSNLEMVVAEGNDLDHIDVSGNAKLRYVDLRGNSGRFDVRYTNEQADMQVLVDEGARVASEGDAA